MQSNVLFPILGIWKQISTRFIVSCFQILYFQCWGYFHKIFRCGHYQQLSTHFIVSFFSNPVFSVLGRRAAMARPSWGTSSPASSRYIHRILTLNDCQNLFQLPRSVSNFFHKSGGPALPSTLRRKKDKEV